ncbi:beta-defensin 9-like [Arvicanthis niloticus]|uniref:beta-defensin 9-like n=1 Tax=Arvicanthis niloticus TaxID=61156 RepID=UPI0014874855|nr:beta-defensin 9-like [Arvicanthis niloticus]
MRTLCSVLLICCLLFSSTTPAVAFVTGDEAQMNNCHKKGGYCYEACFFNHKIIGNCLPQWPRCCKTT